LRGILNKIASSSSLVFFFWINTHERGSLEYISVFFSLSLSLSLSLSIYIYIYICLSQSFFLYRSLTNLLLESAPPSLIDAARALSPPARLPLKIRAVLSYELPGEVRKEATRSWKEGEGKEASVKEGTNSMIN
jgi:hypothetical protein